MSDPGMMLPKKGRPARRKLAGGEVPEFVRQAATPAIPVPPRPRRRDPIPETPVPQATPPIPPAPQAPVPAPTPPQQAQPANVKVTFYLDRETLDRAKAAFWALREERDWQTISAMFGENLKALLDQLERENGGPFPEAPERLPAGRPRKRAKPAD